MLFKLFLLALKIFQLIQTDSLEGYESLSNVQTKGVKKQLVESKENVTDHKANDTSNETTEIAPVVNKLNRKRKRQILIQKSKVAKRPDVVGFESESSSEESEDSDNDEEAINDKEDSPNTDSGISEGASELNTESDDQEKCESDKDAVEKAIINRDDDDDKIETLAATSHKPSGLKVVQVSRSKEVEESRSKLPIIAQEQEIMEMINNHGVVVLTGNLCCSRIGGEHKFL